MTTAPSDTPHPGIEAAAQACGLTVLGGFATSAEDKDLPAGTRAVALLGPDEPRFWGVFTASPEFADGAPDALDRWSRRVGAALARSLKGTALFPFDGPPWQPFIAWALRSGRCHQSPAGFLVHDRAGLWVSFRMALALPHAAGLPGPAPSPCPGCPAPCLLACPADAVKGGSYDGAACRSYLRAHPDATCHEGCRVRAACPAGAAWGRLPAQSRFHMEAFVQQ